MSNFCFITIRQKLDIMVHFKTFITHKHKFHTFRFYRDTDLISTIMYRFFDLKNCLSSNIQHLQIFIDSDKHYRCYELSKDLNKFIRD